MVFVLTSSVLLSLLPSSTSRAAGIRTRHRKSASSGSFPSRFAMSSSSPLPKAAMLSMDFPYLPPVHQRLMSDLLSSMDACVGPHLLPSDPLALQNKAGTSKGALHVLTGAPGSPLDCMFTSWLHCVLPSGVMNITTVSSFLNPSVTSAPHFLLEFIQSSPTSLVLVLDLLPRKDLMLHPDYLDSFYEQTQLDTHRQSLASLPSAKPYVSPNLSIRSLMSPTAVAMTLGCDDEKEMEEVVWVRVGEACRGVVGTWLDKCCNGGDGGVEAEELRRKDVAIKRNAIELDLKTSLPRLFGEELPGVVSIISEAFGLQATEQ